MHIFCTYPHVIGVIIKRNDDAIQTVAVVHNRSHRRTTKIQSRRLNQVDAYQPTFRELHSTNYCRRTGRKRRSSDRRQQNNIDLQVYHSVGRRSNIKLSASRLSAVDF